MGTSRTKPHPHLHFSDNEMNRLAGGTDKGIVAHGYTYHYERHFGHLRNESIKLLELGVHTGGSLIMWERYFTKGKIYGIDVVDLVKNCKFSDRTKVFIGNVMDHTFCNKVIQETGGNFDIIVDDCSHGVLQQRDSFEKFFPELNKNGIYVIEDLYSSYWPMYGGGYRNPQNTVEYLKSLVDHLFHEVYKENKFSNGWQNAAESLLADPISWWDKNIYSIQFYKGICFIYKGANRDY